MSDEVFFSTVDQLAEMSFDGRISYHLYNEPLLRTDLAQLVGVVDDRLPDALQILNTNGDLLDDRRYDELRVAGIDYFYVTRHSPGPYPQRDFQVVQSSRDLTLTNRGGRMTELPPPTPRVARTPCFAPSELVVVTVTGDVLLCYEDARRRHVLGNVTETPLTTIWNSEPALGYRRELAAGNRSLTEICRSCSNVSHASPGLSAVEDPVLAATSTTRGPGHVARLKAISRAARGTEHRAGSAR